MTQNSINTAGLSKNSYFDNDKATRDTLDKYIQNQKVIEYVNVKSFDVTKFGTNGELDENKTKKAKAKFSPEEVTNEEIINNGTSVKLNLTIKKQAKIISYRKDESNNKIHLIITTKKDKLGNFINNTQFAIDFQNYDEVAQSLGIQPLEKKPENKSKLTGFDKNSQGVETSLIQEQLGKIKRKKFDLYELENFLAGETIDNLISNERNEINNPLHLIRPLYLHSIEDFKKSNLIKQSIANEKHPIELYYQLSITIFENFNIKFLELINIKDFEARKEALKIFLQDFWAKEEISGFCKDSAAIWTFYAIINIINRNDDRIQSIGKIRALELLELLPKEKITGEVIRGINDTPSKYKIIKSQFLNLENPKARNGFDGSHLTQLPSSITETHFSIRNNSDHFNFLQKNSAILDSLIDTQGLENTHWKANITKAAQRIIDTNSYNAVNLAMTFLHSHSIYMYIGYEILRLIPQQPDDKLYSIFRIFKKIEKKDSPIEGTRLNYHTIKKQRELVKNLLQTQQDEIAKLQLELSKKELEIIKAKEESQRHQDTIKELLEGIKSGTKLSSQTTNQLQKLENESQILSLELRDKTITIQKLRKEITDLTSQIEEQFATIEKLGFRTQSQSVDNAETKKNIEELNSKINELNALVFQKKESISKLESDIENLNHIFEENQIIISQLEEQLKGLEIKNKELIDTHERLKKDKIALEDAISRQNTYINGLNEDIRRLKEDNEYLSTNNAQLKKENKRITGLNQRLHETATKLGMTARTAQELTRTILKLSSLLEYNGINTDLDIEREKTVLEHIEIIGFDGFETLKGLSEEEILEVLKKKKNLMLHLFHTDKGFTIGDKRISLGSKKRTQEINESYEFLKKHVSIVYYMANSENNF